MVTYDRSFVVELGREHAGYQFTRLKQRYPSLPDYCVAIVELAKLMDGFSRESPGYVVPPVHEWSQKKLAEMHNFLRPAGCVQEMPLVWFKKRKRKKYFGLFGEIEEAVITFGNGRHRARYLEYAGAEHIPVQVHESCAEELHNWCGVGKIVRHRQQKDDTNWDEIRKISEAERKEIIERRVPLSDDPKRDAFTAAIGFRADGSPVRAWEAFEEYNSGRPLRYAQTHLLISWLCYQYGQTTHRSVPRPIRRRLFGHAYRLQRDTMYRIGKGMNHLYLLDKATVEPEILACFADMDPIEGDYYLGDVARLNREKPNPGLLRHRRITANRVLERFREEMQRRLY